MAIKNQLDKYEALSQIKTIDEKRSVPEFNHPVQRKLTSRWIEKIIRKHTNQIQWITIKQSDVANKIEESTKQFIAMKRWFWWFVTIAFLVIVWWIFETYHRFWEVKSDYIKQTEQFQVILANEKKEFEASKKDLENKLENIQKDHDRLKDDNDDLKNELEYLRSRLDKKYK